MNSHHISTPPSSVHSSQSSSPTVPSSCTALSIDDRHKFRNPRLSSSDATSLTVATAIVLSWALLVYHALATIRLGATPWAHVALVWALVTHLYVGLFITCHDAMHGGVCRGSRKLNDVIGALVITLYAWFDYGMLRKKHWEHHYHTGKINKDPDFHHGDPRVLRWFLDFMLTYITVRQMALIGCYSMALVLLFRFPLANVLLFTGLAPIAGAFRLFYFGTYLPHHPEEGSVEWPEGRSRTSEWPAWVTFLQCYHFGYHWEHHAWPYVPWYMLPAAKRYAQQAKVKRAD